MSLNQHHRGGVDSVILYYGERLLIFYDGCEFKLGAPLKGNHDGRVYLTSHRVIFINKKPSAGLLSFSMPFVYMKQVDIKQPVFGANRIEGRITAEPNGGWQGETDFSITFKKGGAIEFGMALIELGKRACSAKQQFKPPPSYSESANMPGAAQYYECPPPAYSSPYNDPYYGFVQQHEAFIPPAAQTLYHTGAPPPYPGATPTIGTGWGMPTGSNQMSQQNSSAHNAKATEAAASSNQQQQQGYNIGAGYHFNDDPHTVFAEPSAPPPCYSAVQDLREKKNQ